MVSRNNILTVSNYVISVTSLSRRFSKNTVKNSRRFCKILALSKTKASRKNSACFWKGVLSTLKANSRKYLIRKTVVVLVFPFQKRWICQMSKIKGWMCSTMASFESPKYWKNFLLLKIIIKCCLNYLKISIDNTFTIQYVFFFRNICLTKLTNENGTTKNILKQDRKSVV